MAKFVNTSTYDTKVLNQLMVMWLVRYSLPWNWLEDVMLGVAFNYVRNGAKLSSWVWAATKAHRLYCNLKEKVVKTLLVSNSLYHFFALLSN